MRALFFLVFHFILLVPKNFYPQETLSRRPQIPLKIKHFITSTEKFNKQKFQAANVFNNFVKSTQLRFVFV